MKHTRTRRSRNRAWTKWPRKGLNFFLALVIVLPTMLGVLLGAGNVPEAQAREYPSDCLDEVVDYLRSIGDRSVLDAAIEAGAENDNAVFEDKEINEGPSGNTFPKSCVEVRIAELADENEQLENNAGKTQKQIMLEQTTIDKARILFSQKGNTPRLSASNYDDADRDFRWEDSYNPGQRPVSDEFKSFRGRPYVVWTNESGDQDGDKYKIGDPSLNVRFVLSEVNMRKGEAVTGEFDQNGVVFVFRNEFNPRIAVLFWSRNAGSRALPAGDWNRFIFDAGNSCESVTGDNDETRMAEAHLHGANQGSVFPDDPESDETLEKIESYGLDPEKDSCDVTTGLLNDTIKQVLQKFAEALGSLLGTITGWLAGIVDIGTLNDNPGLTSAWKTIRDFVNLIFILVLVTIAFSNILRVDTDRYGVRALLPRLVFGVIAVNFSFILVQVMTNAAYIISQPFLVSAKDLLVNPPADASIINPDNFGRAIVAILVLLAVIIALIILLFFFIIRILVIWLLAALSPFVFLFMVLPMTRSLASSWWQNAIKWIFMAPVAFMILYIAAAIISGGGDAQNRNIDDPSFILKIGFFAGAAIAAVLIPLKIGGEVMSRAAGAGRKAGRFGMGAGKLGGGAVAKKTGLAAANEQRKQRAERKQALRGAGIREGFNKRLSAATGGRLGTEAETEAQAQQRTAQEKEAELFANQFNSDEIGEMQKKFNPGSRMHETLGLAHDIRTGAFSERRKGEQLANEASNFAKKPIEAQSREIQDLGSRNVTQFSPNVLEDLATTQNPERAGILQEHLSSGALEGALDQNAPARIGALRKAHANGRINQGAIDSLDDRHKELFNERILGSQGGKGGKRPAGTDGPRVSGPGSSGPRRTMGGDLDKGHTPDTNRPEGGSGRGKGPRTMGGDLDA